MITHKTHTHTTTESSSQFTAMKDNVVYAFTSIAHSPCERWLERESHVIAAESTSIYSKQNKKKHVFPLHLLNLSRAHSYSIILAQTPENNVQSVVRVHEHFVL